MKNKKIFFYLKFIFLLVILLSCEDASHREKARIKHPALSENFKDYWYQGKAELTSYKLEQSRYDEIHEGDAVLIFVTEDFLTDEQVKLESKDTGDATSVLKLNFTKKFNTGIYPYSIMTSTFTPVILNEFPHSLKSTTSIQEWCGHVFFQLNFRDNQYEVLQHSYFQSEGDREFNLEEAWLEDELWARIRIDPNTLPVGNIELIPGVQYLRLSHRKPQIETATATLTADSTSNKPFQIYYIDYENIDRQLTIKFESTFPYAIVGWEETYPSFSGKMLTTCAVKNKELFIDYWNKNNPADSVYRKELGLL